MSIKSSEHSVGLILDLILSALIALIAVIVVVFIFLFNDVQINTIQIVKLFICLAVGFAVLLFFLGFLNRFYNKSLSSIFAFIIEYAVYGTYLSFVFYFVFDFVFYTNLIVNALVFSFLTIFPIFLHELGHFLIALLKGYKPIMLPLRLAGFLDKDERYDDSSSMTLGATVFLSDSPISGHTDFLISAIGPLMNLFLIIIGVYLVFELKFELSTFMIVFFFINGILFAMNIGEFGIFDEK